MNKIMKFLCPVLSTIPIMALSSRVSLNSNDNKKSYEQIQYKNFNRNEIKDSDYENASKMFDIAYKPIGILPLKKHLLTATNTIYKKVKVGVIDSGHINFDMIIKPKNLDLNYKYYPEDFVIDEDSYSTHATNVASFIGGVSGINPNAELYSLGSANVDKDTLEKKIKWAISEGIRIINLSIAIDPNYKYITDRLTDYIKEGREEYIKDAYKYITEEFKQFGKLNSLIDWYSANYGLIFVNASANELKKFVKIYELITQAFEKQNSRPKELIELNKLFTSGRYFIPYEFNSSFNSISVGGLTPDKVIDQSVNMPVHYEYTPDMNFISAIQNFIPKWNNNEETPFSKLVVKRYHGTSFAAPIITGLISHIISIYEDYVDWKFDTADIKNILALTSVYAKDYVHGPHIFTHDIFDKSHRGGKKTLSGYGLPNWVKIRNLFEKRKNKNNIIKIDFNENSSWIDFSNKFQTINNIGTIKGRKRFKAALSWNHYGLKPETYENYLRIGKEEALKEWFNTSPDYSFTLNGEQYSRTANIKYGNHEFYHGVNTVDGDLNLSVDINYYKDSYDKWGYGTPWWGGGIRHRVLKFYINEDA